MLSRVRGSGLPGNEQSSKEKIAVVLWPGRFGKTAKRRHGENSLVAKKRSRLREKRATEEKTPDKKRIGLLPKTNGSCNNRTPPA